ncbi:hypothetical protein V8B97DRAFT_2022500 [Scleroderma yunnanense]
MFENDNMDINDTSPVPHTSADSDAESTSKEGDKFSELTNEFTGCHYMLIAAMLVFHCAARCKATLVAHLHHLFPNENLIYHGYLGCSPMYPTVAILICMFAAFCQSHWVCPHFSIQAQCKALCHLHHISQFVSYQPYFCTQFSAAFNIYLEIIHHIEQCI